MAIRGNRYRGKNRGAITPPMFPTPNLPSMPVNPVTMPVGPMTPVTPTAPTAPFTPPQISVPDFGMGSGSPSSPSISPPSIPSTPSTETSEEFISPVDIITELNALLQRKKQLEAELQLVNEQISDLTPFQGGRTGIAGLFGGGD